MPSFAEIRPFLLILALVLFLVDAFIGPTGRFRLTSLGLAVLVLAQWP